MALFHDVLKELSASHAQVYIMAEEPHLKIKAEHCLVCEKDSFVVDCDTVAFLCKDCHRNLFPGDHMKKFGSTFETTEIQDVEGEDQPDGFWCGKCEKRVESDDPDFKYSYILDFARKRGND